ncbi:MAG: hypothetical protein F6K28_28760 [Microcoleus sp. SIO2G3]|nr:hypothetical protein [Microcoleus sp. SIO2G3]
MSSFYLSPNMGVYVEGDGAFLLALKDDCAKRTPYGDRTLVGAWGRSPLL